MFDYGKIYSRLETKDLKKLDFGFAWDEKKLILAKAGLWLFGYPDVAGQIRYALVRQTLDLKKGQTLLDAGCGNGIYVHDLSDKFSANCVGVDIRKDRIKMAENINKFLNFKNKFQTGSLEKLKIDGVRFDKIICLEVMEHIKNDRTVFTNLVRLLKNKGQLVMTVPKKGETKPLIGYEPHGHVRSGYDTEDLKEMAESSGLRNVTIKPYFFFFSRNAVKIQQRLYLKKLIALNVILSPLLTLIGYLDFIFKFSPRGYLMTGIKDEQNFKD